MTRNNRMYSFFSLLKAPVYFGVLTFYCDDFFPPISFFSFFPILKEEGQSIIYLQHTSPCIVNTVVLCCSIERTHYYTWVPPWTSSLFSWGFIKAGLLWKTKGTPVLTWLWLSTWIIIHISLYSTLNCHLLEVKGPYPNFIVSIAPNAYPGMLRELLHHWMSEWSHTWSIIR